ncbi:WXG100 family type VII secretion target [Streptomyces zagrosensis]|uniref:Uncharacterized protein YukE n=1 Tax=Streptomyces zagrosensis TaxID=1042984 RepID=A0A7W9UX81_9ACTN|nr:hypothetical protein [Streptomyces zagrosensis]MBB5934680.1 uncharacterized protein YukE [Streptomyces zagrosensis]
MADPEIEKLTQRATQLRSLADHIDSLVTRPKTQSTTQMKKWAGPNAEKVRGDLKSWHTKCTAVATKLRQMATDCDKTAEEAKKPKDK